MDSAGERCGEADAVPAKNLRPYVGGHVQVQVGASTIIVMLIVYSPLYFMSTTRNGLTKSFRLSPNPRPRTGSFDYLRIPIILAATGIWVPFESLLTAIAMKIATFHTHKWPRQGHWQFSPQRESRALSPIQAGSCLRECSSWDVNLSTRRVLVGITVLVHNYGSGFPRRQE